MRQACISQELSAISDVLVSQRAAVTPDAQLAQPQASKCASPKFCKQLCQSYSADSAQLALKGNLYQDSSSKHYRD